MTKIGWRAFVNSTTLESNKSQGQMTPLRRAPHLWAHVGVGVGEHKSLLAKAEQRPGGHIQIKNAAEEP